MTAEYLYQYITSRVNHAPYKMLDAAERESIISSAYLDALGTYEIGTHSFVDYASACIYKSLDNEKRLCYKRCREESPVPYEDIFLHVEASVDIEQYIIMQDFLEGLPNILRYIATGYINNLSTEDVCEILGFTCQEILQLNEKIGDYWIFYNSSV